MDLGPPTLETQRSRQATRKGRILRSSDQVAPLFYEGGCQEKKILLRTGPGEIRLASSPTLHAFTKFVMGRVVFASPVTGFRFLLSLV
jgi:hypothetical protein